MVNIRQLCPELAITARDELNEVEDRIPEDIASLREWVEQQPHLTARTDDQFLLTFLRGAKYSMEKAKQKIDYYYTIKSLSPELFRNKKIDDTALKIAKLGHLVSLEIPLKAGGARIHISRYGHINPKEFNIFDLFKLQARILDIEMYEDDNSIIGGVIHIVDMSSISLGFVQQFDPILIKKFGVFSDKAIPLRIKGVHIINAPKEAATVINLTRNLMSKKLKERIVVHKSLTSLYEHIPKKYLPKEYGGDSGCLQDATDCWEKRIIAYKEFFEEDVQYGTNEKLRIGSRINSETLFGLFGSFRKLEMD